jgi:hypothetical protein
MFVKFVLILAWSASGVGFTAQEFDNQQACEAAKAWATEAAKARGGYFNAVCLNKTTGARA